MALTGYERVKRWRAKSKKNASYHLEMQRSARRKFRALYLAKKIKYEKIPKAYRYFVDSLKPSPRR